MAPFRREREQQIQQINPILNYQFNSSKYDMYHLNRTCAFNIARDQNYGVAHHPPPLLQLAAGKILQQLHTPLPINVKIDNGLQYDTACDIWLTLDYPQSQIEDPEENSTLKADLEKINQLNIEEDFKKLLSAQRTFHRTLFDRFDLFVYMKSLPYLALMSPQQVYFRAMFFGDRKGFTKKETYRAFGDNTCHLFIRYPDPMLTHRYHTVCDVDSCSECCVWGKTECYRGHYSAAGCVATSYVSHVNLAVDSVPGSGAYISGAVDDYRFMVDLMDYKIGSEMGVCFGSYKSYVNRYIHACLEAIEKRIGGNRTMVKLGCATYQLEWAKAKCIYFAYERKENFCYELHDWASRKTATLASMHNGPAKKKVKQ